MKTAKIEGSEGPVVKRLVDKDGKAIEDRHIGGTVTPELVNSIAEIVAGRIMEKGHLHHFFLAVYDPTGENNVCWLSPTRKEYVPALLGLLKTLVERELSSEGRVVEAPAEVLEKAEPKQTESMSRFAALAAASGKLQ